MHLLPRKPSSHAVEAYKDSGEALCPNPSQQVTLDLYHLTCIPTRNLVVICTGVDSHEREMYYVYPGSR